MRNKLINNLKVLIIVTFLVVISIPPTSQSQELLNSSFRSKNSINDRIPILKQMGPVGSYEDYINSREEKPFYLNKISESISRENKPMVMVFIDSDLASPLSDELSNYIDVLGNVGYDTVTFEVSGGEAEDIKEEMVSYWEDGYNLKGSVLIGDLPAEWFHHDNDFSGPSEFPCDLFLMDLDGSWTDDDNNGMYDSHKDGYGDTAPEIYIGRIDASRIPGDEVSILKKYFDKVNDFWTGVTVRTELGLTYTDNDWAGIESFRHDLGYAYGDYEAIWYPDVYRYDYVNVRVPGEYEFIQLSCHSSSQGHVFSTGGWVYNDEIREAPPKALFYNLFCCSSLRYTENNCLGYAYILDTDTPSLSVVGSAKTGSMLDFQYFYEPIGDGSSFGTALKEWFEYEYPYSDDGGGNNDISWFYGMTILGDPTLIIKNRPPFAENLTGPDNGYNGQKLEFSLDVFDSDGDKIYCLIDWGDSTNSEWLGTYYSGETVLTDHIWQEPGEFLIRFKLRDSRGYETSWSQPSIITIMNNNHPEKPMINGPNTGKIKKSMRFTFSSVDPEDHDIFFYVSWGDGFFDNWDGPYPSGEEAESYHAWSEAGDYTIIVKAMDQYGQQSAQQQLKIKISKPRSTQFTGISIIFERLLNRFVDFLPQMRQMIGLFR